MSNKKEPDRDGVHLRSDELCERCTYGECGLICRDRECPLDAGIICKCDKVVYGTPCPYFEEAENA